MKRIRGILSSAGLAMLLVALPLQVYAATENGESGGHGSLAKAFLYLAIILFAAKMGNIVERFKQPAVVGELLAGVVLSIVGYLGLSIIGDIRSSEIIQFIGEFGAILLLFAIGLESNIADFKKVGSSALAVALIGVVLPMIAGAWVLAPIFFPNEGSIGHLFLGASLVATSVGITASVFKSMKILKSRPAQTVLGAAVIDDVLGLIVLAVVSALAAGGDISAGLVATLSLKAFGFLIGALLIGRIVAKYVSRLFTAINTGVGMKLTLAISFALVFAYLATLVGLAPIVGAFAAGLLLEAVHFENFDVPVITTDLKKIEGLKSSEKQELKELIHLHEHGHVEDLINNIGLIFVPIFFAYTGLQIQIDSLLNPGLYVGAFVISIVAIATKMLAGVAAKGDRNEKLLVGASMVPRGEVGLIFAATGQGLGVISPEMFSTIIIVVMVTTFAAPFMIRRFSAVK